MSANKFEELIENVPYSSDFYEMRCEIAVIVEATMFSDDCKGFNVYDWVHDQKKDTRCRVIIFKVYDKTYLWQDIIVDDKLEGSKLESFECNGYASKVIYSTSGSKVPDAMFIIKLIEKGIIKKVEI